MAKILCAWELGGGLGHVSKLKPIAERLRARGHQVIFAVREIATGTMLRRSGFATLQAPRFAGRVVASTQPATYAEMLMMTGFASEARLAPVVGAWLDLYRIVQPDLVLANHAPAALLAAQAACIRRATVGTGFEVPPRTAPMPVIRPWQKTSPQRIQRSEAGALQVVNTVLAQLKVPPMQRLADLYATDAEFLAIFPELDAFPGRPEPDYLGTIFDTPADGAVRWPGGQGERVFAYLNAHYPGAMTIAEELKALGRPTLLYMFGGDGKKLAELKGGSMEIADGPLPLGHVLKEARMVVCHAGGGLITASLLAGVPLVLFPAFVEQMLTARSVAPTGAVAVELQPNDAAKVREVLERALADAKLSEGAARFAAKYRDYRVADTIEEIAEACAALF